MGKIMAICISEKRGTQKKSIKKAELIKDFGINGDAHAGKWHRQVSLLSYETIEEFKSRGADIIDGAFGENLVVKGINLKDINIGDKLKCNDVILEILKKGKNVIAIVKFTKKWASVLCQQTVYLQL